MASTIVVADTFFPPTPPGPGSGPGKIGVSARVKSSGSSGWSPSVVVSPATTNFTEFRNAEAFSQSGSARSGLPVVEVACGAGGGDAAGGGGVSGVAHGTMPTSCNSRGTRSCNISLTKIQQQRRRELTAQLEALNNDIGEDIGVGRGAASRGYPVTLKGSLLARHTPTVVEPEHLAEALAMARGHLSGRVEAMLAGRRDVKDFSGLKQRSTHVEDERQLLAKQMAAEEAQRQAVVAESRAKQEAEFLEEARRQSVTTFETEMAALRAERELIARDRAEFEERRRVGVLEERYERAGLQGDREQFLEVRSVLEAQRRSVQAGEERLRRESVELAEARERMENREAFKAEHWNVVHEQTLVQDRSALQDFGELQRNRPENLRASIAVPHDRSKSPKDESRHRASATRHPVVEHRYVSPRNSSALEDSAEARAKRPESARGSIAVRSAVSDPPTDTSARLLSKSRFGANLSVASAESSVLSKENVHVHNEDLLGPSKLARPSRRHGEASVDEIVICNTATKTVVRPMDFQLQRSSSAVSEIDGTEPRQLISHATQQRAKEPSTTLLLPPQASPHGTDQRSVSSRDSGHSSVKEMFTVDLTQDSADDTSSQDSSSSEPTRKQKTAAVAALGNSPFDILRTRSALPSERTSVNGAASNAFALGRIHSEMPGAKAGPDGTFGTFGARPSMLRVKSGSDWSRRLSAYLAKQTDQREAAPMTVEEALQKFFATSEASLRGGPEQRIEQITQFMSKHEFKSGDAVFEQGSENSDVYIVEKGLLRVEVDGELRASLQPGEIFGERSLLGVHRREFGVVVASDTAVLWCMDRDFYEKVSQFRLKASIDELMQKGPPIFRRMGRDDVDNLLATSLLQTYYQDEVVIRQGETGSHMYVIEDGTLTVDVDDNEVMDLVAGEYFGEAALLGDSFRTATVTVTSETAELWPIEKAAFMRFTQQRLKATIAAMKERSAGILKNLNEEEIDTLMEVAVCKVYHEGDQVIRQGDPGSVFYVIESGSLSVMRDGEEIRTLSDGEYFGELALLNDEVRAATVEVESTKVELWAIDRDRFLNVLGKKQ
eukprot:TRINITY_DN69802_c0_g1_i1.p1 TRINITY_DN69802_c0_g1~~TRINITY_DN69802_c0_g1_i1.p1  ORF type:complete len:1067 (+),score=204.84 TRINITY_DN69802_c0_g1_i1:115-3315(+)